MALFMGRTSVGERERESGRDPLSPRMEDRVGVGRSGQINSVWPGTATGATFSVAELELLGHQVQLGLERLVPGHGLAGVGRHAAHDRRQGALGDGLQLVERLAFADARDQVDVLLDVRVDVLALGRGTATCWRLRCDGWRSASSASAPWCRRRPPRRCSRSPSICRHMLSDVDAVGVLVVDREVVEDLPVLGAGADLAAAHADGADRVGAERPVDHVEVVDVLLADVVAARAR